MSIQSTPQYKKSLEKIQKNYGFTNAEEALTKWWHNNDIALWFRKTVQAMLASKKTLQQFVTLVLKDACQRDDCEDGICVVYLPDDWLPFGREDVVERGQERVREAGFDPDDSLITHEDTYYEFVTALVWEAAELTGLNKALEEAAKTCGVEYDYAMTFENHPFWPGDALVATFTCPEKA